MESLNLDLKYKNQEASSRLLSFTGGERKSWFWTRCIVCCPGVAAEPSSLTGQGNPTKDDPIKQRNMIYLNFMSVPIPTWLKRVSK